MMTTPAFGPQIDGQWIDYYALLDVPADADEDSIRRRIGKVYADAASNSDHRNAARREYYQSLVERVLPQCRRVLLDSEWRTRYDYQHLLHREKDGAAQNYVAFIASMRSDGASGLNEALLPQRAQDEINAARQVVETALHGAELELLPSQAVSTFSRPDDSIDSESEAIATVSVASEHDLSAIPQMNDVANRGETETEGAAPRGIKRRNVGNNSGVRSSSHASTAPLEIVAQVQSSDTAAYVAQQAEPVPTKSAPVISAASVAEVAGINASVPEVALAQGGVRKQPGEAARAKVITAQEAADIRRRRRASNPDTEPFVGPTSRDASPQTKPRSRVVVDVEDPAFKRKMSPTSLNLMVAITGVLLTITIQRFASTPAIATSAGRTPIVLAVAPEMQGAIERASLLWEKSPAGTNYDVVVQSADSNIAMQRALGKGGDPIDGWIPASAGYAQRYNELASAAKRPPLQIGDSLAQTPMVLVARSDKAGALRRLFPDHKIGTWTALRAAVIDGADGRFGLSDPRRSLPGAVARYSMAREWGESRGQSAQVATKSPEFWKWMSGFEENIPSGAVSPDAMVKDMVLGTTGRYFWAVSYESDALSWIGQGKPLELFYLPRTALADHPFCAVERVGAPIEVATGRAAFVAYLQSEAAQKSLLQSGFRPTEIAPSTKIENNPFIGTNARAKGVRLQGLPRDERINIGALGTLETKWSEVYG